MNSGERKLLDNCSNCKTGLTPRCSGVREAGFAWLIGVFGAHPLTVSVRSHSVIRRSYYEENTTFSNRALSINSDWPTDAPNRNTLAGDRHGSMGFNR